MRPFIPRIKNDEMVGKAAVLVLEEDVRGVVVVDENNKVNGIVTLTDLTRFFAEKVSIST